jgi:hypothetical protein
MLTPSALVLMHLCPVRTPLSIANISDTRNDSFEDNTAKPELPGAADGKDRAPTSMREKIEEI